MSFYSIRRMQLRFCCGHTKSPVRKYRLPSTNTWITRTSIQMGLQFGGCPGNSCPHGQRASTRNTFRWNCCIESEGRGGVMPVTSAIDPTRRMIRQDRLEEFARALGCRVDELLLAGEPSHRHSLAMEFDPEEVTAAIAARRLPLEESILPGAACCCCAALCLGSGAAACRQNNGAGVGKVGHRKCDRHMASRCSFDFRASIARRCSGAATNLDVSYQVRGRIDESAGRAILLVPAQPSSDWRKSLSIWLGRLNC